MSKQPVNGKYISPDTDIDHDTDIDREEEMTSTERIDKLTESVTILAQELTKLAAKNELEQQQSREIMHRIANSLDKPPKNGVGDWIKYGISLAIVIVGWAFSGFVVIKNTETELRVSNAVREERDKGFVNTIEDFKKNVYRDLALADERYRQLSIDMETLKKKGR